jgi:hypothetical protein
MCDIYAHVKKMMGLYGSGRLGFFNNEDGSVMTPFQTEEVAKKYGTTITRNEFSIVTPIIEFDDIKYSSRITNQKGVFVFHSNNIPFDQVMYTISSVSSYPGRRIYKIKKELKPLILQELEESYGINKEYIYPSTENDHNLKIIENAVQKTKMKFNL